MHRNRCISLLVLLIVCNVHHDLINPTRLLLELQNIDRLNQSLSGCLDFKAIASTITDGLVAQFNCAFARIWLVENDRTALKLVASSGLYTRIDGDFATVPMGAYKVGKIAQHCIPFLSNQLAQESWVKDRQWAINNEICGFAGLPLAIGKKAIGVLAIFSHQPLKPEFLEALKILCSSAAVALNNANLYQAEFKTRSPINSPKLLTHKPLSEQISSILANVQLTLLGTEKTLNTSGTYIFLKTAEALKLYNCNYCRLTYQSEFLHLEAMLILEFDLQADSTFNDIHFMASSMGGKLSTKFVDNDIVKLNLNLPYKYQPQPKTNLSFREQEVIKFLAAGMRDREIAKELFISDRTVKFHINNAVTKLNAKTRIQAVHQAYTQGLLTSINKSIS